ncbi:MAG: hypothetical protein EAZ64_00090, partial [Sphingobacteriales bacterium]
MKVGAIIAIGDVVIHNKSLAAKRTPQNVIKIDTPSDIKSYLYDYFNKDKKNILRFLTQAEYKSILEFSSILCRDQRIAGRMGLVFFGA